MGNGGYHNGINQINDNAQNMIDNYGGITCQLMIDKIKCIASPFKFPTSDEKPIKKVIEQNDYTNQCLGVIGKQLERVEEQIENKVIL